MPCILKQRTKTSPGVITFTQNEVLRGVAAASRAVRNHLVLTANDRSWVYGVHVQGYHSPSDRWELEPWQSFVMWPDPTAEFLQDVPPQAVVPLNCVNLLPDPYGGPRDRAWDLCVVSRPSWIKRAEESLLIMKHLLRLRPNARFVVIAHDPRDFSLGKRLYRRQDIDRAFFDLPRRVFAAIELRQISFIASSTLAFGNFPLSASLVSEIIARSGFVLLTSHREGTPRVLAEALLAGTPCIVSQRLESGLNGFLNERNSLAISDEPEEAGVQIAEVLDDEGRFAIDRSQTRKRFSASANADRLKNCLAELIERVDRPVDGAWYLEDLHLRLAGHGQKYNCQLMSDDGAAYFQWLERVQHSDPYDEDAIMGGLGLVDSYRRVRRPLRARIRGAGRRAIAISRRIAQAVRR